MKRKEQITLGKNSIHLSLPHAAIATAGQSMYM